MASSGECEIMVVRNTVDLISGRSKRPVVSCLMNREVFLKVMIKGRKEDLEIKVQKMNRTSYNYSSEKSMGVYPSKKP